MSEISAEAREQHQILASGTFKIVPDDEFLAMLDRSVRTGTGLRVKFGIDPSSPDIHIGHGVPLRKLRRFQQLGHTAVLIIGDFTGQVGDPTGRSETRNALGEAEVLSNAQTYVDQARRILLPEPLEVVWNSHWLGSLGTGGLLRLASQMTVARMLERDDFAKRYAAGKPISIVEFMYPLLQGYDSVAVRADVEIGGSDQLFNLLVGRDLQQRDGQSPQVAFTLPLLEGTDGIQKMSKSFGNTIGIADPPDQMYGKVMSIPDTLLGTYLRLATDLHPDEIESIEAAAAAGGRAAADAKRRLASEVTSIYHGLDAAASAGVAFNQVYAQKGLPSDIPEQSVPRAAVDPETMWVPYAALITQLGLAASTSEARRLMKQGGVKIDETPVTDPNAGESLGALAGRILRVGKHKFVRLIP